jgi:hypothetical protein
VVKLTSPSPENFVAYLIAPPKSSSGPMLFSGNNALNQQEKQVQDFLKAHPESPLLKTFVELGENQRHRHRWPELSNAVTYCLENRAHLIISEIKNLTHNEAFAHQILRLIGENRQKKDVLADHFKGEFYCLDQPFIKIDNFQALYNHAKEQKKIHGQLIRAGLSRTTAKSGNPHASDVIAAVNKPKIDSAIVFALMLKPIIAEYESHGFSQRKMVIALNEEGFSAPEGGTWVLSQLQKVLDRIKMNEAALTLEKSFLEYRARQYDSAKISEILNSNSVPPPKDKIWTSETVDKVSERVKQIHDILRFNEFVIELMPILEKYHVDELSEPLFVQELKQLGIQRDEGEIG